MVAWRIAREIHGDTTLEGMGGLLVAGRWHRRLSFRCQVALKRER
jgi:hypothetical protein